MTLRQSIRKYCHIVYTMWRTRSRRCALCGDVYTPPPDFRRQDSLLLDPPHRNIKGLCPNCQPTIPQKVTGFCPRCGGFYALVSSPCTPCARCLKEPPSWDRLFFYGVYEAPLRFFIYEAKFDLDNVALALLGELLCLAAQPVWHEHFDAIIPVPLHVSRLRERGGNQCVEISRTLSTFLDVPIRCDLLRRVRRTPHQIGLDAKTRMRNLDNAFEASPLCRGMHVILVDDVMTTGTTLRRCAEILKAAGAQSITVLAVARTKKS